MYRQRSATSVVKEFEFYVQSLANTNELNDILFVVGNAVTLLSKVIEDPTLRTKGYNFDEFRTTMDSKLVNCQKNKERTLEQDVWIDFYRTLLQLEHEKLERTLKKEEKN